MTTMSSSLQEPTSNDYTISALLMVFAEQQYFLIATLWPTTEQHKQERSTTTTCFLAFYEYGWSSTSKATAGHHYCWRLLLPCQGCAVTYCPKLAADGTEDWCYHEYFETGVAVAINTWSLLTENDLLPENAVKCQLLWEMYFLKSYPRTEEDFLLHVKWTNWYLCHSLSKNYNFIRFSLNI